MCFNLFKPKPPVIVPYVLTSTKRISQGELSKFLATVFPKMNICQMRDRDYVLPSKQDVEHLVALGEINKPLPNGEDYNCNHFAFRLYGLKCNPPYSPIVFGVIDTIGWKIVDGVPEKIAHTMNYAIDELMNVWYIEPQTGQLQETLSEWQGDTVFNLEM